MYVLVREQLEERAFEEKYVPVWIYQVQLFVG